MNLLFEENYLLSEFYLVTDFMYCFSFAKSANIKCIKYACNRHNFIFQRIPMWIILIYIFLGLYLPTITRSHHWHYESMIWFSSHCNTEHRITSMSGWGEEHFHCHTGPLGLETSDIFNPAAKNQRSMTASCHVSVERCYYIMISEKVYSYFRMIICLGSFLMSLYCVNFF